MIHSYAVYIGILAFYLVFAYFMYPETKGLTIEEVAVLFDFGRTGKRGNPNEEVVNSQRQSSERVVTMEDGEKGEIVQQERIGTAA